MVSDRYLMGELSPSKLRYGMLSFGDDANFTLMSHAVKTATASINTVPILRYFRGTWYKVALRVRQDAGSKDGVEQKHKNQVEETRTNPSMRMNSKNITGLPSLRDMSR